jgi:small-conductance mechanosensitive channel
VRHRKTAAILLPDMSYQNPRIAETAELLKQRLNELDNKVDILRAVELRALFDELKTLPAADRAAFGAEMNQLREELNGILQQVQNDEEALPSIDVTAPFDSNTPINERPQLFSIAWASRLWNRAKSMMTSICSAR